MKKDIIQVRTKTCPGMEYDHSVSMLNIEGRSIPENPEAIYEPLRDWITEYFKGGAAGLRVMIALEYINSGSSKHLMETLLLLKTYQEEGKSLNIKWMYEEDDEAIMELGEHFRDTSELPIKVEMIID